MLFGYNVVSDRVQVLTAMGEEESEYESVSADEDGNEADPRAAAKAKVAPAPPVSSRMRGASVAPAAGSRRKAAGESSDSVSEAPARREVPDRFDSDLSSSPPCPGPVRPASPEKKGYGTYGGGGGWWRSSGRHRGGGTQDCPICWNEVGHSRSALEQHQRTNLQCLQWQRFNRGGVSWNDAMASAVRRKARRETRAIAASAKMEVPIEHGKGRRETGEDGKREKEEPRPRRQRTSKRDKRPVTPSPEVDRKRRRDRRPPSSDSDDPRGRKDHKRTRQLIIRLPDHIRL